MNYPEVNKTIFFSLIENITTLSFYLSQKY